MTKTSFRPRKFLHNSSSLLSGGKRARERYDKSRGLPLAKIFVAVFPHARTKVQTASREHSYIIVMFFSSIKRILFERIIYRES
jgi:hypothetical protein